MGGGGLPGGILLYQISRSDGSLGPAVASYLTNLSFYSDVVDNQGKFLFAQGPSGVYAFSIEPGTGTLTAVPGSPFPAPAPTISASIAANRMAVDQTNSFLYVSTSAGIVGFTIDQGTGELSAIPGSPFGGDVSKPWAIVVTPNNMSLYELQLSNSSEIFGYSIDQTSGALTPLAGSPFNSGTCGSVSPSGGVGIPGPDNMTIGSAGKFMYDNCGIYSIDQSTGALSQISDKGPGDWPVIDPTGSFLWAITGDQSACFSCDVGVAAYQVDPNTGLFTEVPNSFLFLTNTEVGDVDSLAITK